MGNATSSRTWAFRRPRVLTITAIGGVVAILVVAGTLTLAALNLHNVHASGTGGGGCYSSTGPVCTFKGNNGTAHFESISNCVYSNVDIFASDNLSRSSGTTTQSSYVYLSTYSYNSCTGDYSYGWGFDNGTVLFSQTKGTLNAQGTIAVDMFTGNGGTSAGVAGSGTGGGGGSTSTVTYTLNLTWKAFGTPNRQVSDFHYQSPGYITQGHFTGTSQNAIVSGTLTDGTTNFASTPSAYGEWISADSGTFVTIQK